MKKFLYYLAITIGLVLGCYLIPALVSAQTCPSPTGTTTGCKQYIEVKDNILSTRPIKGVTFSNPYIICTTGADGKCSGAVQGSGTRNYYATKNHYQQRTCLAQPCNNQKLTWKINMVYTGEEPTLFCDYDNPNHTVDYDRGDLDDCTMVTLNFIIPAAGCGTQSQIVPLGVFPIGASGTIYIPNPPLNKEGTIEAYFDNRYAQVPNRTLFR